MHAQKIVYYCTQCIITCFIFHTSMFYIFIHVSCVELDTMYISTYIIFPFLSGNTDIHNGNLKLILALLWSLIAHYQLGASNFPPKKLMLAWLKVSKSYVMFVIFHHIKQNVTQCCQIQPKSSFFYQILFNSGRFLYI